MAWKFFTNTGELKVSDGTTTVSGWYSETFTSQTEIVVTHNLGSYPVVQVFDSSDVEMEAQIAQDSVDQCTVNLSSSSSGRIICVSGVGRGNPSNAIHDDVAGEILAIAQDTSPIGTHEFLSENAAGAKKAIPLANLAYGNPPAATTVEDITLYVDTSTGDDDTGDGSAVSPYATIMKAWSEIPAIVAHDVAINIAPGTYAEAFDFRGKIVSGSLSLQAVNLDDNLLYAGGTATAGTATTLTDSGQSWEPDVLIGAKVRCVDGTGEGQVATITDNDATSITVAAWPTDTPDNTTIYTIIGRVVLTLPATTYMAADVGCYGLEFSGTSYRMYLQGGGHDIQSCKFDLGNISGLRVEGRRNTFYYCEFITNDYYCVYNEGGGGQIGQSYFGRSAGSTKSNTIGIYIRYGASWSGYRQNYLNDLGTGVKADGGSSTIYFTTGYNTYNSCTATLSPAAGTDFSANF